MNLVQIGCVIEILSFWYITVVEKLLLLIILIWVISSSSSVVVIFFIWEIDFGFFTTNYARFVVISSSSFFRSIESTKPNTNTFSWVTNFSCPFTPRSLSYTPVLGLPLFFLALFWLLNTCSIKTVSLFMLKGSDDFFFDNEEIK